jgi:hypothetical protein
MPDPKQVVRRIVFRQLVEQWRAAVPDVHCTQFPMLVQLGIIPLPAPVAS